MSDEKRRYRMTHRAELEKATRLRIAESAVALHEQIGPARTSVTAIAERAGVRRSTVYRHFPDEDALFAACSAHWRALNPPPDLSAWVAIADPDGRTETALSELYAFYSGTQHMYESLLRDERIVPAVARRLRDFHGYLDAVRETLLKGRGRVSRRTRAVLGHALAFETWRSLTQEQQLTNEDAVAVMCDLVRSATRR
jgi:AcrR family transcriptional regulator